MPNPNPLMELIHAIHPSIELMKRLGLNPPSDMGTYTDSTTQNKIATSEQSKLSPLQRGMGGFMEGLVGGSVFDNPNEDINNAQGYGKAAGQLLPLILGAGNLKLAEPDMFGYLDPESHMGDVGKVSKLNYGRVNTAPTNAVKSTMQANPMNLSGTPSSYDDITRSEKIAHTLRSLNELSDPSHPNANNPLAQKQLTDAMAQFWGAPKTSPETQSSASDLMKKFPINTGPSQYRPEGMDKYILPDGSIVPVDATASKGAPTITYTQKGGQVVTARKMGAQ